ncbi:MAG: adenylate/guanylate cyclase domain-containing protein [Bacteroidota bacterium]
MDSYEHSPQQEKRKEATKVTYVGMNQSFPCYDPNYSILDVSIEERISHVHECGGNGKCTTCRVRVLDGMNNLSPKTALEKEIAHKRKWDPGIRLACQAKPKGNVVIQRLVWSSAEISQLQTEFIGDSGGEEREIIILCCDLRNFTEITSQNLVFDMVHMLNRFYTLLGDPILVNNGIIYQYVGDEIVGIFGTAGGDVEKNCTDAIRAALGMQYALERLNQFELKDLGNQFDIGIGIHYGKAYLGHMGHPKHRQFAVIGDPINIANRIQSETKGIESKILISEDFLKKLPKDMLELREEMDSTLRGKEDSLGLYGVKSFRKPDMNLEVQASLSVLLKNEERFAESFYERVFEKAPQVRSMFKNNMTIQGRLLTHMLGGIVYSLSRPGHLKLGLKSLGKNHAKYGVMPTHYPVVKEAMLETIEAEMGDLYNDKIGAAWTQALDFVLMHMIQGHMSKF